MGRECTRAATATWGGTEGADGANGYVFFYFFVLSTLLFYSHHSSSFPIVSFSVEYDNRRAGRDGPTRAAIVTRDGTGGQAGTTGTSSVALFLPTLLFSSSYFYNLCCRELQQQTGRGRVGRDRTERDGGQAGGRRR